MTTDVVLTQDLLECPGDGLIAAAPGITINLNYHRIDGDGQGAGIRILAPDVTVRLGPISDFATGILLRGGGDVWLADLTLEHNGAGISDGAFPSTAHESVTVLSSRLRDNETGLRTFLIGGTVHLGDTRIERNGLGASINGSRAEIVDSVLVNNDEAALIQFAGSDSIVIRNEFRGNRSGFTAVRSGGLLLSSNRITQNSTVGVSLNDTSGTVRGNTINRNGEGLHLSETIPASRALYEITNNTIRFNTGYGVVAFQPGFQNGGGNVITNNNGNGAQCLNFPC